MEKMSRQGSWIFVAVCGLIALSFTLGGTAWAAPKVIKYGHFQPAKLDQPKHAAALAFKNYVEANTKGSIKVEVYGSPTPIKQIASVGAPEPTQIVIRPYDPGTLKDIEKAIQASDLGFNPQNDGRVVARVAREG